MQLNLKEAQQLYSKQKFIIIENYDYWLKKIYEGPGLCLDLFVQQL